MFVWVFHNILQKNPNELFGQPDDITPHFIDEDTEIGASQVVLVIKNPPANCRTRLRDTDLILGSGRFPGEGHGNPLHCSCLENPMDRGAWQATVHGVAKSQM